MAHDFPVTSGASKRRTAPATRCASIRISVSNPDVSPRKNGLRRRVGATRILAVEKPAVDCWARQVRQRNVWRRQLAFPDSVGHISRYAVHPPIGVADVPVPVGPVASRADGGWVLAGAPG